MSGRRSGGGDFSMGPGLNATGAHRDRAAAYRLGHDRPSTPEGMRALTPAEQAHSCTYTWSPALATYTCEHFPEGVA